MTSLAEKVLAGDEPAAARLISLIENGDPLASEELLHLIRHTGRAHRVGITGPPGSGKSTIAGLVASALSDKGNKVGIIAVDPTSLRGGGALLADRIRMKTAEQARGVFIRSMADRGCPGGICSAVRGAQYVLEGLGKDVILVESVGAGQSDKGIFFVSDTVITVFTPDYGDEFQLLKGGLLEIGDIVVVNKSDLRGAIEAFDALSLFLGSRAIDGWATPVMSVQGINGKGIDELVGAISRHKAFLDGRNKTERAEKDVAFTLSLLKEELWGRLEQELQDRPEVQKLIEAVRQRTCDPYSAVQRLLGIVNLQVSGQEDSGPSPP